MRKLKLLIFSTFFCTVLSAQNSIPVSGTVTSKDGSVITASVVIKGSVRGTSTDAQGHYTLPDVAPDAVLIFSSVGFQTTEVSVNGKSTINVSMDYDAQSLDEVIAVAYGTARKGTFTGSADVINQKDIKDVPSTSFQNALIGKAPGVQITEASGQAGSVPSIRIRGIGSMNASNEPLYVIDGVPVVSGDAGQISDYTYATNNVMNTLNPNDIESITILKDAAASALYGSRAANGVVVINTKKGKTGKPKINLSSSLGFTPSWATDNYEPANVQQQVDMLYQVFWDYNVSDGETEEVANKDAIRRLNGKFNKHGYSFETAGTGRYEHVIIKGMTDGKENREGKYYDWEKAYFRTGQFQNHDLSVSGGDQNTKYYSSLSYTRDENRIKVNDFDRITGRVSLSQKIGKLVEFASNVNVAKSKQSGYNDTRNLGGNYYLQTRNLLWPLYWPTDYKTGEPWTSRYGSYAYNGIYYDKEWENNSQNLRLTANESITLHLLPGLDIKSVFSYDNVNTKDHIYYSSEHYNGSNDKGVVNEMVTINNRLVSSSTINYAKDFGKHHLDLLGGFEAEKNNIDFTRATGKDLPSSALHTVATAGQFEASGYSWGNNMLSYLSRVEYNYNQKYYGSASFRRDGSSKLGPDTRWGNFWSIAGAWRINNESFMSEFKKISNLRLRASYGVNGTLPINNYGWRSLVIYDDKYMDQAGGSIQTIADPNLTWETSYTTNLGIDFGLFDQRLYGTVEYFNRNSKNLLQDVPISTVTGFPSTLKNVGEINNHGIEISVGGDIIRNSRWRWSANANASFINSSVTKLYAGEGETKGQDIIWYDPTGDDDRAQFIYREGQSTLAFYGYEWAGVDPANGKNRWYVNDPNDKTAGDFVLNGRGATYDYDNANYTILGSAIPKVFGGFSSEVQYANFSLNAAFIYKIGGYIYDGAYKDVADDGYYWERIRAKSEYDNMWTESNKNGTLPELRGTDLTDPIQYSSRQMTDASFLRLKNITLAYNLPVKLISRAGITNVRIHATGSNLLTFSKYKEADPEVNNYGTRGWETPFGKTFTFGIDISF
ncbi:MAG: SusC/RagA family TonB-linked outer membrane protein [Ginsengibacter sp.]